MATDYYAVRAKTIVEEMVVTELQYRKIQAGEDLVQYTLVYQDGEVVKKSDATNPNLMPALGLVNQTVTSGIPADIIIRGRVNNPNWSWTSGVALFASTTAGEMTETPPTTSGYVSQRVAIALTQNLIELNPFQHYIIGE